MPWPIKIITGERVLGPLDGFNPSYQRHVALYLLCAPFLPNGQVLDLGCGIGHSRRALAPRRSVVVDVAADVLKSQQPPAVAADMRALPFRSQSFDAVLSVHAIEHVPDPQSVLLETVRILDPQGTAIFVTPNRLEFALPEEIIDPYHFIEFDPDELAELCRNFFEDVQIIGLSGSERWRQLVQREIRTLKLLIALDPFGIRRQIPRRARQYLYDALLTFFRTRKVSRLATQITTEDFFFISDDISRAFDLIAICKLPRTSQDRR